MEKHQILNKLSPPLDALLVSQLLDEFISMERRFIQRDWEPAELDGGHFCEVLARILYHQDSGNTDFSKNMNDCLSYIEDFEGRRVHNYAPRSDMKHLVRVVRTIYNFRNNRGVAHISFSYNANHMDAKFVIESVRWCMNEVLRLFWKKETDIDKEDAAKAIRELLQFDVPAIGKFDEIILVQRTDLTPEEEIIVLLHYAGEQGFTRKELGQYAQCSPASVTRSIEKLESPQVRQIIKLPNDKWRLTDLGSKRVREELSSKLLLE